MKKASLKMSALVLSLTILSLSCASLALPSVPPLKNRTLFPASDGTFYYPYEVCETRFIGCIKRKWVKDTYDPKDPVAWKQLMDMGFVLKVREPVN